MKFKTDPGIYKKIVFFTGAGISAESNIPTYRGSGGIWHQYNYEDYAFQRAFDKDPLKVLEFHRIRREAVLKCEPNKGHLAIAEFQKKRDGVSVITQNIDGLHRRAGSNGLVELHGSLFRVRCSKHGVKDDPGEFKEFRCNCGEFLRPDIVWFGDMLDREVINNAIEKISECDLFISIGTSGVVWPAAGFPEFAKERGARLIEINPEKTEMSFIYDEVIKGKAGDILPLFLGTLK